jgi:hypothetical protein
MTSTAMAITTWRSSTAPLPMALRQKCPMALTAAAVKVSPWRRGVRLMSERNVDGKVTVTRLSIRTAARHGFGPRHVRRWVESALALATVCVHFVTRADESGTRDGGVSRLGRCFAPAWVWTHHPSQGSAENPRVLVGNPCPVSGLPSFWFPRALRSSLRQLMCSLRVAGTVVSPPRVARREFACP